MEDTLQNKNVLFKDFLVRPHIRLVKLFGAGLFIIILLITLIFLGYRGRRRPLAPVPTTIIEFNEYAVPFLMIAAILSIIGIIFLLRLKDIEDNQLIVTHQGILKFQKKNHWEAIRLKQAKEVSFHILPLFHKLYNDQFYRIGRLIVRHEDQKFSFYFPVRNESIGNELSLFYRAL